MMAFLMVFFRHLSIEDLISVGERQNEILTRSIGNPIWSRFGPYLSSVNEVESGSDLARSNTLEIAKNLAVQLKDLPVLRVDILNLKGDIVFSTTPGKIFKNISADIDFIEALSGRVNSRLVPLNGDDEWHPSTEGQKILSSYLPLYDDQRRVAGVFQIFTDITILFDDIEHHVIHVFLALIAALGLLYVVLYQVVRRADQTIKKQHFELKSSETELRESEKRIRALVDSAADGIVTFDQSNVIKSYNAAAKGIFGLLDTDVIGRNVSVLIDHGSDQKFQNELKLVSEQYEPGDTSHTFEIQGLKKDGSGVPLEVALSVSRYEGVTFFAAIMRDISERKKLDQLKNEFISTVSHELRTPLTSIAGSLGLIASGALGKLPKKANEMVEIAYRNSSRLDELINDILDIDKLESGMMVFNFQSLDISELVRNAVTNNQGYAARHGAKFVLADLMPGVIVRGDEKRLTQVVANLLSNAAKFSPDSTEVSITVTSHGGLARVSVSDLGATVPEEFRENIFEKFSQVDSSDRRQTGGSGLGLSIAKSIVEKHGGSINLNADAAGGNTFFFNLPMA
ncbi:MAG: PAS domain S-box protein [Rhodospirillales bacterium]|nr:PAS domain S-box protein [Rhodospirillales bacterium]